MRKVVIAAVALASAAFAVPAEAQSDPVGRRCSFTSVTDPTVENGQTQTGQINGGPIGQPDNPAATVTLTCTIQVGAANSQHSGGASVSCTATNTGATSLACQASYVSPEGQPVYLCTEVTISGKGTFYWDANLNEGAGGWSRTGGLCNEAISQEIFPGPLAPVLDLLFPILDEIIVIVDGVLTTVFDAITQLEKDVVDPIVCDALKDLFPPDGDIPGFWDCPPYGEFDVLPADTVDIVGGDGTPTVVPAGFSTCDGGVTIGADFVVTCQLPDTALRGTWRCTRVSVDVQASGNNGGSINGRTQCGSAVASATVTPPGRAAASTTTSQSVSSWTCTARETGNPRPWRVACSMYYTNP